MQRAEAPEGRSERPATGHGQPRTVVTDLDHELGCPARRQPSGRRRDTHPHRRRPTTPMPSADLHAVVISTALKPGSKTRTAADLLATRLAQEGLSIDLIDLATEPLPACDGFGCYQDERVHVMTRRVRAADLIAVCFPVYNYQPNAAAKNFVELTNDAWKDKVVTFVANAGGDRSFLAPLPLANALMVDHRCVIVPQFLYLPPAAFDAAGRVVLDPLTAELFEQQVAAAHRLARAWASRGRTAEERG